MLYEGYMSLFTLIHWILKFRSKLSFFSVSVAQLIRTIKSRNSHEFLHLNRIYRMHIDQSINKQKFATEKYECIRFVCVWVLFIPSVSCFGVTSACLVRVFNVYVFLGVMFKNYITKYTVFSAQFRYIQSFNFLNALNIIFPILIFDFRNTPSSMKYILSKSKWKHKWTNSKYRINLAYSQRNSETVS